MSYRPRRSQSHWQALIDEFDTTECSAKQFCHQRDIAYSSFLKWKQRLQAPAVNHKAPEATFIELGALTPAQPDSSRWRIELALGDGMVLRLEQH